MPDKQKADIETGAMTLVARGDRAILNVNFRLHPAMLGLIVFVLAVSAIWSVEQCLRWASALIKWLSA